VVFLPLVHGRRHHYIEWVRLNDLPAARAVEPHRAAVVERLEQGVVNVGRCAVELVEVQVNGLTLGGREERFRERAVDPHGRVAGDTRDAHEVAVAHVFRELD